MKKNQLAFCACMISYKQDWREVVILDPGDYKLTEYKALDEGSICYQLWHITEQK